MQQVETGTSMSLIRAALQSWLNRIRQQGGPPPRTQNGPQIAYRAPLAAQTDWLLCHPCQGTGWASGDQKFGIHCASCQGTGFADGVNRDPLRVGQNLGGDFVPHPETARRKIPPSRGPLMLLTLMRRGKKA